MLFSLKMILLVFPGSVEVLNTARLGRPADSGNFILFYLKKKIIIVVIIDFYILLDCVNGLIFMFLLDSVNCLLL